LVAVVHTAKLVLTSRSGNIPTKEAVAVACWDMIPERGILARSDAGLKSAVSRKDGWKLAPIVKFIHA